MEQLVKSLTILSDKIKLKRSTLYRSLS